MFEPIISKPRKETDEKALIDVGYESYKRENFIKLFERMKQLIHFSNP
jgi:hypothetical protein